MTVQELVARLPVVMMATVDRERRLTSRPMLAVATDGEIVWFLTRADSGKLAELAADARVNLAFVGSSEYASVSGTATVSKDRDMVARLWRPTYRAWFPEGRDDPGLALLKVTIERADYWETASGPAQRLIGVVKALVTGEPYEVEKQPLERHSG